MDNDWNCKNTRADALRGRWTMIGIAKKKCKNKRVYALRDGWTPIGIEKKSAKIRGYRCIKGRVANDWNC